MGCVKTEADLNQDPISTLSSSIPITLPQAALLTEFPATTITPLQHSQQQMTDFEVNEARLLSIKTQQLQIQQSMIQMMALGGVMPQNTGNNSTIATKTVKKTPKRKNYNDPDKIMERQEKRREYYVAERA